MPVDYDASKGHFMACACECMNCRKAIFFNVVDHDNHDCLKEGKN